MKKAINFKTALVEKLGFNSNDVEVFDNVVKFSISKFFEDRWLNINVRVELNYEAENKISSYITNNSNAQERAFARQTTKELVSTLIS